MGRYFFNLNERSGLVEDKEGRELADLKAVRLAAIKGARSIICHEVVEGVLDLSARIEVLDVEGRHVLTLRFRDAVEVKG